MKKRYLLISSIIFLAIGFAAVSTIIFINGTVTIKPSTAFKDAVIFTNVELENSDNSSTTITLSDDKKEIYFETTAMKGIGTSSVIKYQIKNNSAYDADIDSIICNEVDENGDNVTANGYVVISPYDITGLTVNKNAVSPVETITISQIKSYMGARRTLHFKCIINASASEE